MTEISGLSVTDASNLAIAGNSIAEGCPPSSINDAMRALSGALARDWQLRGPVLTAGGTANAITLTPTAALPAYAQGQVVSFIAAATNTGAATLNISGLGTKAIRLANAALTGGEIVSGQTYALAYDGTAFQMISPPGTARGALIGVQVFATPGTATYTPTTGTNSVVVEVQAGGGGGGGVALTGASASASAGGGGAGGYARKRITSAFSGVTVTVGDGGAGGVAGNNSGTGGASSSFGALVSATGGSGGGGSPSNSPSGFFSDGGNGGVGSSGDINVTGGAGFLGISLNFSSSTGSGFGGSAVLGGGAKYATASAAGNAAGNYGGGGGGAANLQSQAARAGGKGGQGVVIVWEYA